MFVEIRMLQPSQMLAGFNEESPSHTRSRCMKVRNWSKIPQFAFAALWTSVSNSAARVSGCHGVLSEATIQSLSE